MGGVGWGQHGGVVRLCIAVKGLLGSVHSGEGTGWGAEDAERGRARGSWVDSYGQVSLGTAPKRASATGSGNGQSVGSPVSGGRGV